ncbi:MAG: hypothetical protein HeimC2_14620 [Candidatus Heimdallarchaeota archaeon LC_2]|nr:MAG: hypothetical protein HeimC2_14620 [Candidatus Heimdallarchaeota archaeon LC_2]
MDIHWCFGTLLSFPYIFLEKEMTGRYLPSPLTPLIIKVVSCMCTIFRLCQ